MLNDKKNKILVKLAAVVALSLPVMASATPINGGIGFGGAFFATGGTDLSDATGLDFLSAFVLQGVGDFVAIPGLTSATFTDFDFNPLSPSPVTPLWAVSFGGIDYSFNLNSVNIDLQNASELNLSGAGTVMATGFDDTDGMWLFSGDSGGSIVFTFSSVTATNPVPEPGTLLLLALGVIGIGAARRSRSV